MMPRHGAAVALLLAFSVTPPPVVARAPNVIIISSDSMDGRLLDPLSGKNLEVALPNLRALAASGANFRTSYSHSPVCGPSRASLFTSRYVQDTGVFNNYQELPRNTATGGLDAACVTFYGAAQCEAWAQAFPINATLIDAFLAADYDVAVYGKLDVGAGLSERYPNSTGGADHQGVEIRCVARGADFSLDSMGAPGSQTNNNAGPFPSDTNLTGEVVEWLLARDPDADRPFFLYSSINLPHFPFVSGPEWLQYVNTSAVGLPRWPDVDDMHPYDLHMTISKGCYHNRTDAQVVQLRQVYLAMAAQADALHGQILQAAKDGGHIDDTIIVFWSDHGEMAWEYRQVYKDSLRDPSSRVPLIFSGPGISAGGVYSSPASLVDVWPTLSDLTGIPSPPKARGHSLAPYMAEASSPLASLPRAHPGWVVGSYFAENSNTGSFMVRQGDVKLIVYGHTFPWFADYPPQLFNLTADPLEFVNLAPSSPAMVAALEAILTSELGDYEALDALAKANDLFMFRQYVLANHTIAEVQSMFDATFAGFNETYWGKVLQWNATNPVPVARV